MSPKAAIPKYPADQLAEMDDDRVLAMAKAAGCAAKIEDDFRLWAFDVAWQKLYASEYSTTLRFIKALVSSVRPVKNETLEAKWKATRARELLAGNNASRGRPRSQMMKGKVAS